MLLELKIEDFAIIDALHVQFAQGLTVLTGETGAGKSILIGAISLLLGSRARTESIRHGCESACVEGLFDVESSPEARGLLEQMGIESTGELSIRRLITRAGKNRLYINGSIASLNQLQSLAPHLVSIFGQHEYQSLQRSDRHLHLLDQHGDLEADLERYREGYRHWQQKQEELRRVTLDSQQRLERLDLLRFQHEELGDAKLRAGEEVELHAERSRLQYAEKLGQATLGGFERLYGADGAVVERIDQLASELEELRHIDPSLVPLAESLRSAQYGIEDAAQSLRAYGEGLVSDPERLDEIESRLAFLERIKRKYISTVDDLILKRDEMELELEQLSEADGGSTRLQAEVDALGDGVQRLGLELRHKRVLVAEKLCEAVKVELCALAMERTRLEFRFEPLSQPSSQGLDTGELYFSANPGEALLPLARVASGGELSRLMLALRRVAPDHRMASALIFDEVDAGVGGATASAIGEKLRQVSVDAQVLCITHLPQVAAFADHHLRVEKEVVDERTRTRLTPLAGESRTLEMARMLGGANLTERTLEHARELVARSGAPELRSY